MRTPPAHERSPRGDPALSRCAGRTPASPRLFLAFLLPAALLCTSCGSDDLQEVHGKVLYKGQPARGAVVVFHPKPDKGVDTIRPTAIAQEDGSFTLTDHTGKEGAAAGTYVVTIVWPEEKKPEEGQPKKRVRWDTASELSTPPDRLRGRYASPAKSNIVVEVKPGVNQLEPFDLK
jgi:hypothetical protein